MNCDRWLVVPHIEVNGARRLLPCWDEPHLKTTFTISIKHHRNFTALSNMPIRNHHMENEIIWTHFYTTPLMSIYHLSIVLTNFPHIRINANNSLWCERCSRLQSLKYAKQIIKNITMDWESEFGRTKISKVDHVVIPDFPQNSMSKLGLVFHR